MQSMKSYMTFSEWFSAQNKTSLYTDQWGFSQFISSFSYSPCTLWPTKHYNRYLNLHPFVFQPDSSLKEMVEDLGMQREICRKSEQQECSSHYRGGLCGGLEKAMAPNSSTLAWKIPWTEEPGGLQSMGSLRVRHDWATSLSLFTFMHWRRKWQPTPVFLPGESQGWESLVGCRLWVAQSRTRLKQLSSSSSRRWTRNDAVSAIAW